jgi:hypothetical protein
MSLTDCSPWHEFFDLRSDPSERTNLAVELPDLAACMFETITFFRSYDDSLRVEEDALGDELILDELERIRALNYVR